jgi:integrase
MRSGLVPNPNNVLRNFAAIVSVAGVPAIGVHDLRYTHATFLLLDGVPLKVVSERLGHPNTSITLDTYAHVLPGFQHLAAPVLFTALFG